MKNIKHLFFDLDNTLTRSRSLITPEMKGALNSQLEKGRNIIVVSGATEDQIFKQIGSDFRGEVYVLAQNGNKATILGGKDGWANILSPEQKEDVFAHIDKIRGNFKEVFKEVKDEKDLVQDRGCQISFSLIGHNEKIEKKEAFDPGGVGRSVILKEIPLDSDGMEVKIGGTTCLDYIERGKHKGCNVARLIEGEGWQIKECVYFGDALYSGGNDESVVGYCPTQPVKDPSETLLILKKL